MVIKKFLYRVGCKRVELVVNRHANALLALAHAEGSRKLNLVAYSVVGDKALQLLDNLTRAFYVT